MTQRPDVPVIPVNDLARAVQSQRAELDAAIAGVMDSGWFVMGPEHDSFERELAAYLGVRCAVGVANGTDALALALAAAGCAPGDRVLTVANAGGYTSTACRALGLEPVYVDVDPQSLLMTADTMRSALAAGARAVVVTHLYGAMAPIREIVLEAEASGVAVIEDCAQAIGARLDGGLAGSFGRLAIFSFYPTKNLGGLGDGGAVVTSDDELAERVRSLRQYGWRGRYRAVEPGGRNSRLDEMQAAVLRVRLQRVDDDNERRREIHRAYAAALDGSRYRMVHTADEAFVAHLNVMSCGQAREKVRQRLRDHGVLTDVHYPICDHRQPLVENRYAALSLPVSESAAESVLTLPSFPELRDDELERVCAALADLPQ
jgi:dTDP-4-amino-4,6-dideoxygalactose transaminase